MFEIQNITKKYGTRTVLDDVSLSFKTGQITSLVGANGAGKSTLLSIMACFLKQDSGEILFEGKNIKDFKNVEIAKKVASLRQSNSYNIRITVRELVAFGRFPHSKGRLKKEDEAIIDKSLDYMMITSMQHKYIDQLSGGERQRVFIAMILAQDTDHILLDEPLNNLDMKQSSSIMKNLRNIVDETKKTIIIVVHDINCASCYSEEIVALKNGKLVLQASPEKFMREEVIKEIFDVDCKIAAVDGNKICVYHNCEKRADETNIVKHSHGCTECADKPL
ncbi:MAG: ATP-binding cassette domain-containing protein [Firmicutes bacterium]|nr:ATP-binding cassette domain-containing protein [Bacillota bacterium]